MKAYMFGVDVGGTTVKLGLFRTTGELEDKWEIPTNTENGGARILPDIAGAIRDKLKEKDIAPQDVEGVGIGVPGAVLDSGVVNRCVNLGWGVTDVKQLLSGYLDGMRVEVGNDANVAALGEMWNGGGKGYQNIVMVTLGTGVGGGVILNGRILSGSTGAAGELGHFKVNAEETETCGCGKKGCLEQYASANGIARMAAKRLAAEPETETVLRKLPKPTSKDIFDAAKQGDAFAASLVEQVGELLGKACAYVSCTVNPEAFVIGGGVSKAGPIVTDTIERYHRKMAFHACENTRFELAVLGNDAGIYGAARMLL